MNATRNFTNTSFKSTQASCPSFVEACRGCLKYGFIPNCLEKDLNKLNYTRLAGMVFNPIPINIIEYSSNFIETQLFWHAYILGSNPEFKFQIIKNLVVYCLFYICEEYAEQIENALRYHNLHVARERDFICNIIEELQKGEDNGMLALLDDYTGKSSKELFRIYAKDYRYLRLLPLLSIIFLRKNTSTHELYMEILEKPELLSRENSLDSSTHAPTPDIYVQDIISQSDIEDEVSKLLDESLNDNSEIDYIEISSSSSSSNAEDCSIIYFDAIDDDIMISRESSHSSNYSEYLPDEEDEDDDEEDEDDDEEEEDDETCDTIYF